jgi:molybdopterin converting factor small subunit
MINIMFKYLAIFREATGQRAEAVEFPDETSLAEVVDWLNQKYRLDLPNSQSIGILNGKGWDQTPAKMNTKMYDGDTISLMPLILGG